MKKVLIIFAHPAFHKSRINRQLINAVKDTEDVTVNNLYENYPDFFIDVEREQELLTTNDIIVWHHPFYWYSAPALLKEWFDLVLQHGFAYGNYGRALEKKTAISVITTGGRKEVYSEKGKNQFTINQFLAPYKQSANLCRMDYLPPFVVHGSHTISPSAIIEQAEQYKKLILALRDEQILFGNVEHYEYLNDINF